MELYTDRAISSSGLPHWAWWICIVVLIRVGTGWLGWQSLSVDTDSYAQLAINLAEQGEYGFADVNNKVQPTAYRPPLYPWLLSWLVSDSKVRPGGVFLLHLCFSLVIAILGTAVGRRLGLSWAWVVGILLTVDPLLIRAGQQLMTELLAVMLVLVVWWLWLVTWPNKISCSAQKKDVKRSAGQWLAVVGLGITFGLSILARPTAAAWWALCTGCLLWFGCNCWKRRLTDMVVVVIGALICVVPWTLRNMAAFGKPIWATTHGGYTLLLANNPSLYRHYRAEGVNRNWDAESFHRAWAQRGKVDREALFTAISSIHPQVGPLETTEEAQNLQAIKGAKGSEVAISEDDLVSAEGVKLQVHSLGELADDELAYSLAMETIKDDLHTFTSSCFYRICWLWAWWPVGFSVWAKAITGFWYGTSFTLALLGLWRLTLVDRHRLGSWLPGLLMVLALTAVHCFYWSNMRMRCPAMPCIYLLALLALQPKVDCRCATPQKETAA